MPTLTEKPAKRRQIPKLKFSEPRHNLPGRKGIATAEDHFTIGFARAYFSQAVEIHRNSCRTELAMAREIPANGYGIADLIAVAWAPSANRFSDIRTFLSEGKPCSRAFECKMTDWRRAMSQAGRYRFFSHQAIVVLPELACQRALPYLETFMAIKVGLWSYDSIESRIRLHHTPRIGVPKSERYYLNSVEKVHKVTKRALPIL
jgi:hypothetical protein